MVANSEICEKLDWDSNHFGVSIGRLKDGRMDRGRMEAALEWARAEGVACLYWLVDPASEESLSLAAEHHFEPVDRRVSFERACLSGEPPAEGVRPYREGDLPELEQIAAVSHQDSRFYRDGRFNRAACDAMYRVWIRRSVEGWAQQVFVAEEQGSVAGYCSCHLEAERVGRIGLIAVEQRFRGRGLGEKLMRASLGYFAAQGVERVEVVTQGANEGAQRLYRKLGFEVRRSETWFHRWETGRT